MCPEEECCIEGKCRPFISVGKKCDPFSQVRTKHVVKSLLEIKHAWVPQGLV